MEQNDSIKYWITISEYDLETAQAMLDSRRYLYVGFMCHQSIEKVLKAIYVKHNNEFPPRIHNLARLIEYTKLQSEIPGEHLEIIHELNPLNIMSRYPDQEFEIMNYLSYEYCVELIKKTERLYIWLKIKAM